ncbi:phosphoenolpyruvate--protein phosphotransferase [Fodinibius salsisoli]|uniref:Phosphoenolpyruvate-protein phosphotransferase n=1 Tax=Fodinibius salsisoli TaxID=2820877 RepID=A0ABT3PRP1_9BACT|nr:phosphoenolpyruvate--protein phosphotransferase [Fodinibius salsisoli]MCW9708528.1 phosphoenolpyruvate--protein phosphotransferase [Fodinibius salsisoli]
MNNQTDMQEMILSGAPASPGITVGKARLYKRRRPMVSGRHIPDMDVEQHINRFNRALSVAEQELQDLIAGQDDEEAVELLQAQVAMLNDPDLKKRVELEIKQANRPADAAIDQVFGVYIDLMEEHQEGALKRRSLDLADARDRLIQLVNDNDDTREIPDDAILVAHELSPREVIEFSEHDIRGIVMDRGGITSHAAILARSMQIPTVVGVEEASKSIAANELIILDGNQGKVIVKPSTDTQKKYDDIITEAARKQAKIQQVCDKPNETVDGAGFTLRANIEFENELPSIERFCAQGVGLLRTESIYLHCDHFDDEQKQYTFYGSVLEHTAPHPVIIRLFDAGGDKLFNVAEQEQNPFLGWRGIRMLLDKKTVLKQQLRAILKAAGRYPGRLRILVPMISSLDEVAAVRKAVAIVQGELQKEGEEIDPNVPIGIMVEVPNVAIQARAFAKQVDFLSIGTNDLTQYLLAVDRGNERISGLYSQRHPALWQLIKQVADAGKEHSIPVSVCGELASDPAAACCLLGMGITELSMTPSALPAVKQALCTRGISDMQALASKVLESTTVAESEEIFTNF